MLLRARSLLPLFPLALLSACGGDSPSAPPAITAGGAGGNGGRAGASGSGASAGVAGGAGQGGKATAGASGQGTGGTGGAAGGNGACTVDADCTAPVPVTTPAGCAEWTCEKGVCAARARDKDADTHRAAACKAVDGTPITTGDDCDDGDKETFPGAWDGPADGTNPDRCDGRDQNCSNDPDDVKAADGKSCSCTPGDSVICAEDGGGKVVAFPALDAAGKPLGKCRLGKRTCGSDGKLAACVGTVPPDKLDICNGGIDDDCDGKADLLDETTPPNLVTWSYDGDGDGYVSATDASAKQQACDDARPTVCPTSVPGCDLEKWKLGSLPAKDCDDTNGDVNPAGVELCSDEIDNDCNGVINDDYASDAPLWYFDWDGDNYGDISTPPKRSCKEPTTFPEGCTDLEKRIPADYCGDLTEGDPVVCPAPACAMSMWKRNLPNTDCKDRPDQGFSGVPKGNKPKLVYPGATDLCNGRDYNCDGSPNTACGCEPVGRTAPCGAEETCNLGTQVCIVGGTWDTSKCDTERPRVDLCPDDDADGYCDLTKCVTNVCPDGAPKDGHLYRERTKCLGFATPDGLGSDCEDDPKTQPQAKDINPGLVKEVCNGDGLDHNCNRKSNTPGAGDCECTDGGPVACQAPGHSYPVSVPPDTYPYQPVPPLPGICAWDTKSCFNGTWTACTGGTGAYVNPATGTITELCNNDGLDHDCDGKTNKNGGCQCQNGETIDCGYTGPEAGICKRGKKTCQGGTYVGAACVGAVGPNPRDCSSGVDNDCDGKPDNTVDGFCECAFGTTNAACGAHPQDGTGTCKAGARNCNFDGASKRTTWGTCNGSVGPNPSGEGCGPKAADVGCDNVKGNGPSCTGKFYVLSDPAQYTSEGPSSFLLSTSPAEAYYTETMYLNAFTRQPAGVQGTDWEVLLRCVKTQPGKWHHTIRPAACIDGHTAEGVRAYVLMGIASQVPTYNPLSYMYATFTGAGRTEAWFPVGTAAQGAPQIAINNKFFYDIKRLNEWNTADLQASPYFGLGDLP